MAQTLANGNGDEVLRTNLNLSTRAYHLNDYGHSVGVDMNVAVTDEHQFVQSGSVFMPFYPTQDWYSHQQSGPIGFGMVTNEPWPLPNRLPPTVPLTTKSGISNLVCVIYYCMIYF